MIADILMLLMGMVVGGVMTRLFLTTWGVEAYLIERGPGRDWIIVAIDGEIVFEARVLDKATRTPLRLAEGEDE